MTPMTWQRSVSAYTSALQQHVPRMTAWIQDTWDRGLANPDREKPKREWGGTQVYVRPGESGHTTH
jgi:hypothetical protein